MAREEEGRWEDETQLRARQSGWRDIHEGLKKKGEGADKQAEGTHMLKLVSKNCSDSSNIIEVCHGVILNLLYIGHG